MKYDDASWHYGGDFPSDLPQGAGSTHIAMFLAWAASRGLISALHIEEAPLELAQLAVRSITPVQWFTTICDEKLTAGDLDDRGNLFARAYYANDEGIHAEEGSYIIDYIGLFSDFESPYEVPDTWTTFDAIARVIDRRFETWLSSRT